MKMFLPFPVSVNALYAINPKTNKLYKTKRGKEYQRNVEMIISALGLAQLNLSYDVMLSVVLYLPDDRVRDLDNVNKILWDSLVSAGVIVDDDQIVELHQYKYRKNMYEGEAGVRIEIEQACLLDHTVHST